MKPHADMALFALAALLLVSCGTANTCPDGAVRVGDRCVGASDASPADAGRDGDSSPADAGASDAAGDASS